MVRKWLGVPVSLRVADSSMYGHLAGPGFEKAILAVLFHALEYPDPGLLECILGFHPITAVPEANAHQQRGIAVYQSPLGIFIASEASAYDIGVLHG